MKAMYKLVFVVLVIAGGCDSTRRDWNVCDINYQSCLKGFTCDVRAGLCVPGSAILPDAAPLGPEVGAPDGVDDVPVADAATLDDGKDSSVIDGLDGDAVSDAPTVDVGADVPPTSDLAPSDVRTPDAQGSCSVDNDCVGGASGLAYCVAKRCVACKTNNQCNNDAGVPFCSAQNTCVSCAAVDGGVGTGCPASAPACDPSSGSCVECVQNSQCPTAAKGFCVQNRCQGCNAFTAITGSNDGGTLDGGSSADGGIGSGPCTGAKPACATSGAAVGQCVQCVSSADCSGTTPVCNTATNTCTACTSDTQCAAKGSGPGVCMFHQNGRCASDAETIYVQNSAGCSGGTGTLASPYCRSQDGINAVTAAKRVVVMRGTVALGIWTSSSTGGQISVFGQNNATISPGVDIGVHIISGDVYIRGLNVQGGGVSAVNAGIVVDTGATVHLDRCVISKNAGGLLVHNGAGFEIANSVFAVNQTGTGDFGAFGGVSLGSKGTGLPGTFWFNTVVDNQQLGVVCTSNTQSLDGVLLSGNIGGDQFHCTMPATSKSGATDIRDPQLDATYHLTATSPCRDFIDMTVPHPADDIDGESRPKPATGRLDCGADEY